MNMSVSIVSTFEMVTILPVNPNNRPDSKLEVPTVTISLLVSNASPMSMLKWKIWEMCEL